MPQITEHKDSKEALQEESDLLGMEGPKAKYRQFYYAIVAHLGALIMATVWSWSSTALPSLRLEEGLGNITMWVESWIASITFLAGAIGSFAMGWIAQKVGLHRSLLISTVPLFIGWLLITFANSMTMILIGRFLTGFFVAGVGVSNSLVGEYSKASRRGRLNFIFDLNFCIGVLLIYIVGTFFPWRVQAGVCSFICVIFFALLWTIPESARCLVHNEKEEDAKRGLQWARDNTDVGEEFNEIIESVKKEKEENLRGEDKRNNCSQYFNKETMKPVFLATALQFFLQVCGVVPIVCYAVDVFKAAGTKGVHENVSTIVLGAVNLGATIIAFNFVDKYGRRVLMMGSEAILTLTLFLLGTFLFFKNVMNYSLDNWFWSRFPLACFVLYITAYSFGVGPLPWVLMGEILAPSTKGFSSGLIILAARVFGFFVMFFFKDMIELVGQHGVYWFFSFVCLGGLVFSYLLIPETRKKGLEEIQELIQGKWFHFRETTHVRVPVEDSP